VQRVELLASLAVTEARVVWVAASPGCGKTTLLAQYADAARARGERVSWLSLDESDSDARELAGHLCYALARLRSAGDSARDVERETGDPELALIESIEAALDCPGPMTLCLDDCHLAAGEQSGRLLGSLLRRAEAAIRIIATSQGQPTVPLADLELKGVVRRLGTTDLCLTESETRSFVGGALSPETIAALVEKTAGWPIALLLARAQVAKHGESTFDAGLISGTDPTLARYFSERVLDRATEPIRSFLLETSILERVNGDVADAVRESVDAWGLLEEIQRRGLFLEPSDPDGEWFQYHPLFREFLALRLRRSDFHKERGLRRRAAAWFARHAAWPEAIRQALRADDIELAAQIVDRTNYLELILRFGRSVLGDLEQLPDEHLARYPRLALCVAYAHFQEGRLPHARRLLNALPSLGRHGEVRDDAAGDMQRHLFEALIEMCEDRPNRERLETIEAGLVRGEVEDPLIRGECYIVLMVARQDQDDPPAALALSDRLLQETQAIDSPYLDGFTWLLRGMVHMARAELGAAEQCYEQCLTLSQRKFGRSAAHTPIVEILLAEALYERERFAEAIAPLERGLQRIDNIYGWHELWEPAILTAAPLFLHLQGVDRTLAFLQESGFLAQTRGLERAAMLCEVARVAVLTRAGRCAEAAQALERSSFQGLLESSLNIRTSRVLTPGLIAAHDLALARGDPGRWSKAVCAHIPYLRERGLRRRLLGTLLAQAASAEQLGHLDAACAAFREALELGATRGYIRLFHERAAQLRATVARVAAERLDTGSEAELRTMLASMRESGSPPKPAAVPALLSPREAQVLSLMPEGLTSKQMAQRLRLTENTVKGYRRSLFEKLGVTSRSQAIEKGRALRMLS
jgi:LuxR family transcriptional regulator, maltose regulon positive regulatory protein